jgi:hypothetical protein
MDNIFIQNTDLIKKILEENKETRDDDKFLYITLCFKLGYDLNGISAMRLIQDSDKFPRFDSVTRTRRLLQEEFSNLRGNTWSERQEHKQKVARHEVRQTHYNQRGQGEFLI